MWLRDGLPVDFPNARILIYGQDTGLLNSMSFQNLLDLGGKLRSDLRLIRAYVAKPIVLIGHSLGGLILKKVRLRFTFWLTKTRHLGSLIPFSGNQSPLSLSR